MGEIKSTMDLVMERAAGMGKASRDEIEHDEARKKGMRLAADFLGDSGESLFEAYTAQPEGLRETVRQGMAEGLFRNVFLPRDQEGQERTERAVRGLIDLAGGGDIASICQEMETVIGKYSQHRQQLREQLEEQVSAQHEQQLMAKQAGGQGTGAGLDSGMLSRFQEEWSRLEQELNSQYNQALDQYCQQIRMRMGINI
jgi:hypothetical protein